MILEYHGRQMRFEPTRILCLQAHGPLGSDEPNDANILYLLGEGYAVFVQLEPGDATRYGLMLTGARDTISAMRIGSLSSGTVPVRPSRLLTPNDCAPLAPTNTWSQTFFAWWLNALVEPKVSA